jgi:hypothetical protein
MGFWQVRENRSSMGYDDVKEHDGQRYSGMPVGGTHEWRYPDGRWEEEKKGPDRWSFSFSSKKRRRDPAPEGSGADPGTKYHWYILGHQRVQKIDKDSYQTLMQGLKYKLAHKRPYWKRWSSEYPDQRSRGERLEAILEAALARARQRKREPQASLEEF